MIDQRLIKLRKKIRTKGKYVIDKLIADHYVDICFICGSNDELTNEHVIPRWVFDNNPDKFFNTQANGLSQTYSKTTIPSCFECNSPILGSLERYLEIKFRGRSIVEGVVDENDLEKVVLWLELLDYKFQVLNLRRTFKRHKNSKFVPYLSTLPISLMQNESLSIHSVFSDLRKAQKRLSVKSKADKINSLVIFRTKNKEFHFFHQTNEFIFLELPEYSIALFYFYRREFKNIEQAFLAGMEIIKKVY